MFVFKLSGIQNMLFYIKRYVTFCSFCCLILNNFFLRRYFVFATAAATVVVVVVVVAAALVAVDVLGTSALTMLLKLIFVKIHICKEDIN